MNEILNITKALSDDNRVRAVMMLADGELCVCQIIEMLGLAPSTVSKHMSILRQAGLVATRKQGRWIYYRLADSKRTAAFEITKWLNKHLKDDPDYTKDLQKLKKIKAMDIDEVCKCYRS